MSSLLVMKFAAHYADTRYLLENITDESLCLKVLDHFNIQIKIEDKWYDLTSDGRILLEGAETGIELKSIKEMNIQICEIEPESGDFNVTDPIDVESPPSGITHSHGGFEHFDSDGVNPVEVEPPKADFDSGTKNVGPGEVYRFPENETGNLSVSGE